MAQLDHPQYPGLKIIVGDKAQAGAWFVPKAGLTLSHIANQAYGVGALPMVLKINKSLWNRQNLTYRVESTKCASPVVDSGLAASQSSFAPGAWVALCQNDTPSWAASMGFAFPPVWLPPMNSDAQPGDLAGGGKTVSLMPITPGPAVDLPGAQFTAPGDPQQQPGGFRWYHGVGIGLGVLAVGGIAWAASKDKGKK